MEDAKRADRRRHSPELKAKVLAECAESGASIAQVALAHGLNANLVHKWRRQVVGVTVARAPVKQTDAFIALALPPQPAHKPSDIRIELRRGATVVNVTWPLSASADCAAWMRELLK